MSLHEDGHAPGDGGSFWEVEQYKRTVKRQEDGHKLCGDLIMLIEERAKVEKDYAKSLKAWNKKWLDLVEKGPEYATMEGAIKGMLGEADSLADVHLAMKDKLVQDVSASVKQWRSENYHKGMVGPCKETKALEDEFKKAQKTWAKKFHKVQKAKKDHHTACKLQKTAQVQEANARGDSGMSPDQMKKIQEKAEKCRRDVDSTKEKYEHTLRELKDANPKYMEDMTEVFNKSQEAEQKRLEFFKEMLYGIHKCLEPSSYPNIPHTYTDMQTCIDSTDSQQDLKWFSNFHGVDMPMNWPAFEEYSPDLHTISRKEKKPVASSEGITMTSIKRNEAAAPAAATTAAAANANNHYSDAPSHPAPPAQSEPKAEENGDKEEEEEEKPAAEASAANPFGDDDEWGYDGVGNEQAGVPVRAVYDYAGEEADELSFRAGDVLMKVKDKDEQGWCTGRVNGRVGLYPDNYCELIQ